MQQMLLIEKILKKGAPFPSTRYLYVKLDAKYPNSF